MEMRQFGRETQCNYIRDVGRSTTFLGRSSAAAAEEVRRFQVEQSDLGTPVPTMNSIVSALRFFFLQTLDRPDPSADPVFTSAAPLSADATLRIQG